MFKTTISPEVTEGRGEPAYNRAGAMDTDIANSGVTSRGGRAQPQQQNLQKAATQQQLGQLKFTTADGRGRQTSAAAGGGAISAAEIDNDFNILASILSEEINHFGEVVMSLVNVFQYGRIRVEMVKAETNDKRKRKKDRASPLQVSAFHNLSIVISPNKNMEVYLKIDK